MSLCPWISISLSLRPMRWEVHSSIHPTSDKSQENIPLSSLGQGRKALGISDLLLSPESSGLTLLWWSHLVRLNMDSDRPTSFLISWSRSTRTKLRSRSSRSLSRKQKRGLMRYWNRPKGIELLASCFLPSTDVNSNPWSRFRRSRTHLIYSQRTSDIGESPANAVWTSLLSFNL